MRTLRRLVIVLLAACVVYGFLLVFPQPLFAYQLRHAGITLHATRPIPESARTVLERVRARLDRSPVAAALQEPDVFLCDPVWLFALFARHNYRVGGIVNWGIGQHPFIRKSELESDRLIGPNGYAVAADRPLSYFIAHELMHSALVQHVGRRRYSRLPQWLTDGYADYVARDIDLADALEDLKAGAERLDPRRSGLYIRYQLMVAFLLDRQRIGLGQLLESPPERDAVERTLRELRAW
jgi:hypothetical protein